MFDLDKFIATHITRRPESLLQADLDHHHYELYEKIRGRSVLVIGGAGTIGSSFIKALLPYRPGALTVVDYNENGLTELTRDLRSSYQEVMPFEYVTYPFDFGGQVFPKLFQSHSYDIVACFAAHKHVRSEKDHLAIEAMVRNNVFNTKKLLDLLKENPPERFFAVSTDKAANPVNVMGASKKLMEKLLLSYSNQLNIVTARFANVAFSNGSLLYGFLERMQKRQPISAPNDVRRYFVSPAESGQLCLLACILGNSGDIFFPKLREEQMMTFSAIAEAFLRERGLKPDESTTEHDARQKAGAYSTESGSYPVFFFETNTSGEKLYEEFYAADDKLNLERFEALGIVENTIQIPQARISEMLGEIEEMFEQSDVDKAAVIGVLGKYLPDFKHIETGKRLDDRM